MSSRFDATDCFEHYEPGLFWKVVEQVDDRHVICEVVRNDSSSLRNVGFGVGHRRTFEVGQIGFKVRNLQKHLSTKHDSLVDLKARLAGKSDYERSTILEEFVFGEKLS